MFRPFALVGCLALGALALAGCQRAAPPDPEKVALDTLISDYEPKSHKTDDKGRVVNIELNGPHVDDDAMDHVAQFKMLKELSINGSAVSDAGFAKLRDLKRLTAVGMTDTRVTDRGIAYMQKMPSLRYVWVTTNANLTQAGIDAVKKATPGVTIYVMNAPPKKAAEPKGGEKK